MAPSYVKNRLTQRAAERSTYVSRGLCVYTVYEYANYN